MHKVIILRGLPGAGKTTFANQVSLTCDNVSVVDVTPIIEDGNSWDTCDIPNMCFKAPNIIIDGKIYDDHTISLIINAWEREDPGSTYLILDWIVDKEACINNLTKPSCSGDNLTREEAEKIIEEVNIMPYSNDIIAGETGFDTVSIIYRPTFDFTKSEEVLDRGESLSSILLRYSIMNKAPTTKK
jgi:hypothetical protein